jgi:hypothetical protein
MEAMLYYVQILHNELKARNVKRPVLLLIDGFSGHISIEALKFAKDNNIIIYCLLANATNVLQPCDVAVFQPMKTFYKEEVKAWQSAAEFNSVLTQKDFPKVLRKMLHRVKPEIIRSGFEATGIFPFGYDKLKTLHKLPARPADVEARIEDIVSKSKPAPENEIVRYLCVTKDGRVIQAEPSTPFRDIIRKQFSQQVRSDHIFEISEKN